MKKILLVILVGFAVYRFIQTPIFLSVKSSFFTDNVTEKSNSERVLEQAFKNKKTVPGS